MEAPCTYPSRYSLAWVPPFRTISREKPPRFFSISPCLTNIGDNAAKNGHLSGVPAPKMRRTSRKSGGFGLDMPGCWSVFRFCGVQMYSAASELVLAFTDSWTSVTIVTCPDTWVFTPVFKIAATSSRRASDSHCRSTQRRIKSVERGPLCAV